MEKSKKVIVQALICVGLLCAIWGGYFLLLQIIEVRNEKKFYAELETVNDFDLLCEVEDIVVEDDRVKLLGWGQRLDSKNDAMHLILQPMNKKNARVLTADSTERKDIGAYFRNDWEFGLNGFSVEIDKDKIEPNVCYELLFALDYETDENGFLQKEIKKVTTKQYLYNDELYRYNPVEFRKPEVSDAELQKVIEEGSVRCFDDKNGVWIYQHGVELYFITEAGYKTETGNEIVVPIMVYTSWEELYPEEGARNIHLGFLQGTKKSEEKYRVEVISLPIDYPITYINTGLFDMTKGWIQSYCIDVDYEYLFQQ